MANIKSSKKRISVIRKRTLENRMVKTSAKNAVKKFVKLLDEDPVQAQSQLSATTSIIDKAVTKGVMHKNAANRKKARLARALNKVNA
ncbi:MAG: 30S ribosomal protein S20 [Christensenellales bacterium]|nr:30S ribosomal protein S20 [Clostridiales bacterium]